MNISPLIPDTVAQLNGFLDRMHQAGLIQSYAPEENGHRASVMFTERGRQTKQAFQDFEKAASPQTPAETVFLLRLFIKREPLNVPNPIFKRLEQAGLLFMKNGTSPVLPAAVKIAAEKVRAGLLDFGAAMGNISQSELILSWVILTEKYNTFMN